MIPVWIIDELKRQEEETRRREEEQRRERLELPVTLPHLPREEPREREPGGPVVIDLWPE